MSYVKISSFKHVFLLENVLLSLKLRATLINKSLSYIELACPPLLVFASKGKYNDLVQHKKTVTPKAFISIATQWNNLPGIVRKAANVSRVQTAPCEN